MLWCAAGVLLTFTVLFTVVTTVGRVCLGPNAASATRYIPCVLPGLLAMYLLPRSSKATRMRTTVLVLFLAGVTTREITAARNDAVAVHHATHKRLWADCYLARHAVAECDAETGGPIYPAAEATGLQEKLDWLEARRYSLFQERTRLRFGPDARAERVEGPP